MIKQPSLACQSVTELFTELNIRPFQIFTLIALLYLATERLSRNKKKYLFINCYLLWIKQKTNKLRVQTEIPRISGYHWLGPWRNYSMDFSFFLSFQEKMKQKEERDLVRPRTDDIFKAGIRRDLAPTKFGYVSALGRLFCISHTARPGASMVYMLLSLSTVPGANYEARILFGRENCSVSAGELINSLVLVCTLHKLTFLKFTRSFFFVSSY